MTDTVFIVLSFIISLIAGIPPLYFTYKLWKPRRKQALVSLTLSLILIFHSLYHLFELIGFAQVWSATMEMLFALSILVFSIFYLSEMEASK